jgi:hypothetical protein
MKDFIKMVVKIYGSQQIENGIFSMIAKLKIALAYLNV